MMPPQASSERLSSARGSGWASAVLGVVAVAALPAAIALAELSERVTPVQAGASVPIAGVVALAAIVFGRRVRRHERRSLTPVRGARAARVGRVLGYAGLYLAATGAIALAVYAVLTRGE